MAAISPGRSWSLRITLVIIVGLGLLSGHANGQGMGGGKGFDGSRGGVPKNTAKEVEDAKRSQERESAYRDAMKRIPDAKPEKNDPWKGAR